jgi:hypothetical protein
LTPDWTTWKWAIVAALAALLAYVAFRAYLGADFLIGFANMFTC